MITALTSDLKLPEYVAFNYRQSYPRMRQWELPFALFSMRLADGMAVIDFSINPVDLAAKIRDLFAGVSYRHCSPIRNGVFHVPTDLPDCTFDRVVCVNTLEHLLAAQRDILMAVIARVLKPGGVLVLTCDYYFDSFRENPALIRSGVVRRDGAEVFNGWNKVTVRGCTALAESAGLLPLDDVRDDPHENDPSYFRNIPAYPHACIAGVFQKPPATPFPKGRTIVLGLLTWNTRDCSVESVHSYVREARMLRRLGQEALVCVCDNGSTDGTAEALEALAETGEPGLEVILNPHNVGNSVARNQIIRYMLANDADYLLMMDGDIEVVPFSSFAMMRYMEESGEDLGCLGADSFGHSPKRQRASAALYSVRRHRVEDGNTVAWTQYGMFRRALFDKGIRFDESEAFQGAGWGFEDNDLAFQIECAGFRIRKFVGMTYLHRAMHSSVRVMRQIGVEPVQIMSRRQKYVVEKWSSVPHIATGPLNVIRKISARI